MFRRFLAYHTEFLQLLVGVNALLVAANIYSTTDQVQATGFAAVQFLFIWLGRMVFNRDLEQLRETEEALAAEEEDEDELLTLFPDFPPESLNGHG